MEVQALPQVAPGPGYPVQDERRHKMKGGGRNYALDILGPWLLAAIWLIAWTLPAAERDAVHENWR